MSSAVLLPFIVIVLAAGFVQGASGFGFGLFSIGFLTLLFTVKDAVLIVVTLSMVTSLVVILHLWRHIDWRNVVPVLAASLVGRLAAFPLLSMYGESQALKAWLAVVLGFFAVQLILKSFRASVAIVNLPLPVALLLGFMGGITGGLFSSGGPWLVLYFLSTLDDSLAYKANLQVVIILPNLFTILLHSFAGDYRAGLVHLALIGLVAAATGSRLGVLATRSLRPIYIRRIASFMILFASLNVLARL